MNRRDVLKAGLSVLSAAGIDGGEARVVTKKPSVVILTLPAACSQRSVDMTRANWKESVAGTVLEGVRTIIVFGGSTVQIIDDPKAG